MTDNKRASPEFSVLTVSKRRGWASIAAQNILAQTIRPNLWVIIAEEGLDEIRDEIERVVGWADLKIELRQAPLRIRSSNLNRSLNAGLRLVRGGFVIFYQDFIELQPDCFEKLLAATNSYTFVTTATINADGSNDSRYIGANTTRQVRPEEWEANVAIAPMRIVRQLGGFDEEYDNGWSWDNVNLADRAAMLGCRFLVDETNRPQLLYHPKERGLPTNGEHHVRNMALIRAGKKKLSLDYLKK